jgi:FkbM family methyltransferase
MDQKIHTFRNSIRVYDSHLIDHQRERYLKNNVHEEDEEGIFFDLISKLSPGDVFVNVGTAIGYYPILSKIIRKDIDVHCFEPLPRHLDYFQANMKLNGISKEEFYIHQVAISTETGEVPFQDSSYGSSLVSSSQKFSISSFLRKLKSSMLSNKKIQSQFFVKSIRLAEVFELIKKSQINLLQMDIQGFELPVLNKYFEEIGGLHQRIETFLVGTHSAKIHAACLGLFQRNGYQILENIPDSLHQPDGIICCRLT